jgi:membrane protein DedA with SNARE-associated domain
MALWGSSFVYAAIHLQNKHVHGAPVDYAAVVLSSFASWIGVPGPGEAVVVTAGIFAAKGRLNLGPVLFYAWIGATAGGVTGWLIGRHAGRPLITAPGPLLRLRMRAVERSERLYERFGILAVFLTPSWGAGIARMGTVKFLLANAASAAAWAILFGVGSYLAGSQITDWISEIGLAGTAVLVAIVVGGGGLEARRRHRRQRRVSAEVTRPLS